MICGVGVGGYSTRPNSLIVMTATELLTESSSNRYSFKLFVSGTVFTSVMTGVEKGETGLRIGQQAGVDDAVGKGRLNWLRSRHVWRMAQERSVV